MRKLLAIIPARGGSKRIPKKNIRPFNGRPIISYPIIASTASALFEEVMVSTDDAAIAEVARQYGAAVPFMRSPKNSNDFATTADVLIEVVDEYRKAGRQFDVICCIYPTAPFVTPAKLTEAFALFREHMATSMVSVIKFSHPVQRALQVNAEKRVEYVWPENINRRTQDLNPLYYDAGQFYFLELASFLDSRKMLSDNTIPYFIRESEAQDIDNEEDWEIAQMKYELLQKKELR